MFDDDHDLYRSNRVSLDYASYYGFCRLHFTQVTYKTDNNIPLIDYFHKNSPKFILIYYFSFLFESRDFGVSLFTTHLLGNLRARLQQELPFLNKGTEVCRCKVRRRKRSKSNR